MVSTIVAGIDPGLVHTGLVVLEFSEDHTELSTSHAVIDGLDPGKTRAELDVLIRPRTVNSIDIFIERYRPRSGFATNDRMMWANTSFPSVVGGAAIQNTGVLNVVRRPLLELLGLWKFQQTTHHDDLRSAARVAILGMMRDDHLNRVLYDYTTHTLEDTP